MENRSRQEEMETAYYQKMKVYKTAKVCLFENYCQFDKTARTLMQIVDDVYRGKSVSNRMYVDDMETNALHYKKMYEHYYQCVEEAEWEEKRKFQRAMENII